MVKENLNQGGRIVKATELMLGDWVSALGKNCCITSIDKYDAKVGTDPEDELFFLDDIYPIPLTPEILEKNGFCFVKSSRRHSVWNGYWLYKDLELGTCCLDRENNWPCFFNTDDMNIECEYVHQLQHILRLCKLGDLADNFKI